MRQRPVSIAGCSLSSPGLLTVPAASMGCSEPDLPVDQSHGRSDLPVERARPSSGPVWCPSDLSTALVRPPSGRLDLVHAGVMGRRRLSEVVLWSAVPWSGARHVWAGTRNVVLGVFEIVSLFEAPYAEGYRPLDNPDVWFEPAEQLVSCLCGRASPGSSGMRRLSSSTPTACSSAARPVMASGSARRTRSTSGAASFSWRSRPDDGRGGRARRWTGSGRRPSPGEGGSWR